VPHFHACDLRLLSSQHALYRIYVTASDLLVFRLGVGAISDGEIVPRTRPDAGGAAGLMAAVAARRTSQQIELARRVAELDVSDEATLRHFIYEGNGCFTVTPEDLRQVRIDPPSGWLRFLSGVPYEGTLRITHRQAAGMALALPSVRDARRAVEELTRLLGASLQVHLTWGSTARRRAG
jgi:hypothetical protein